MTFSPEYVRLVLDENFEDAKALLLEPLMAIHFAHLAMLAEQHILSPVEARQLRAALDGIDLAAVRGVAYDGSCEDLFFYVNGLITQACGEDVAGRLHTARSRNDIDMTMYRMRLREGLLTLGEAAMALRTALIAAAEANRETIFAAHTHAQPAQPTTVAHYLLAMIEQLERDTARLSAAYDVVNRNPLGACAITGTGFPIDRNRTSGWLGFAAPTGNTYGSIAAVDYLLQATAAGGILLTGLGRFVQDMLLWCTVEMSYLSLPDGFVQTSSIMPQKRNPVALEHARALASKALGQLNGIASVVHNTPFGDIVDTEDDLQPLVAAGFRDATRAVRLVAAAMTGAQFNAGRMRERAGACWVTATELADTLARDHGISFTLAHTLTTRLVRASSTGDGRPPARILSDAAAGLGLDVTLSDEQLRQILSPEHFIAVRRTSGGPAPEVTAQALAQSRAALAADLATTAAAREALVTARAHLRRAVDAL